MDGNGPQLPVTRGSSGHAAGPLSGRRPIGHRRRRSSPAGCARARSTAPGWREPPSGPRPASGAGRRWSARTVGGVGRVPGRARPPPTDRTTVMDLMPVLSELTTIRAALAAPRPPRAHPAPPRRPAAAASATVRDRPMTRPRPLATPTERTLARLVTAAQVAGAAYWRSCERLARPPGSSSLW